MKAAVYRGNRRMEVEDVDLPVLNADEFLLDVSACTICGSDLHAYVQDWYPLGAIMGHEYSGYVSAVGADVTEVVVGEPLAIIQAVPCGECRDCIAGRTNLCIRSARRGGGYAEQVVLNERCVHFRVPEGMAMDTAALLEPVSVAVRAVNRAGLNISEPVVVIGLGSIGQSIVQILKARGVSTIIAVDLSPKRLELAARAGARPVNPADGDVAEQVQEIVGTSSHRGETSSEATTVFECSGSPRVVDDTVGRIIRKGGTIVMVALFESPVTFDPNPIVRKEVNLLGSFGYVEQDWTQAFELLSSGAIDAEALISQRVPLSQINEAFAIQLDKSASMKVAVIPDARLSRSSS